MAGHMWKLIAGCALFACPSVALANDVGSPWQLDAGSEQADSFGTLNPDELTLNKALKNAMRGDVDMMTCAHGYLMTKMGNHGDARTIFENCAAAGYTGTMTWMSYMDDNGFGLPQEDAKSATAWDRKAAEMGDPIGQLNYGLDLLRGRGVDVDEEAGRQWVDRAADAGERSAIELRDAGYDYTIVTPDADEWKYKQRLY